jgi:hypothetical protein
VNGCRRGEPIDPGVLRMQYDRDWTVMLTPISYARSQIDGTSFFLRLARWARGEVEGEEGESEGEQHAVMVKMTGPLCCSA